MDIFFFLNISLASSYVVELRTAWNHFISLIHQAPDDVAFMRMLPISYITGYEETTAPDTDTS